MIYISNRLLLQIRNRRIVATTLATSVPEKTMSLSFSITVAVAVAVSVVVTMTLEVA